MLDLRTIQRRKSGGANRNAASSLNRSSELFAEAWIFGDYQDALAGHRGLQRSLHPNEDSNTIFQIRVSILPRMSMTLAALHVMWRTLGASPEV